LNFSPNGFGRGAGAIVWRRLFQEAAVTAIEENFMPSIAMTIPHALGQEQAIERLQRFLARVKEKYQDKVSNLSEEWVGNQLNYSFSTFGFNIKGEMTVGPDDVKVNGGLPFAAVMFKGQIEQTIRSELERLLG
jgi:hypothetical protein